MTTHSAPLKTLTDAAAKARESLGLRYRPIVIRNEGTAWRIAVRTRGNTVMLGDRAYWVVCLSDAERLAAAGYEWAPRN